MRECVGGHGRNLPMSDRILRYTLCENSKLFPVETHWPKIMRMTHLVVLSISVRESFTVHVYLDAGPKNRHLFQSLYICIWGIFILLVEFEPSSLALKSSTYKQSSLIVIKGLAHWRELMDLCHSHVYHSHYLTSNTYKTVFFTLPFLTIFSHFYVP